MFRAVFTSRYDPQILVNVKSTTKPALNRIVMVYVVFDASFRREALSFFVDFPDLVAVAPRWRSVDHP